MYTRVLGLTISALILAFGAVGAIAQDRMTSQPDQQQAQSHPSHEGAGTIGQGGMMGGGMMGHGRMGGGAMGPPIMLRMMFALMDGDGDGTISLTEFQVAHERIFRRWTATRMDGSRRRRCKRLCTGLGDRFRSSRKLGRSLPRRRTLPLKRNAA
jgi:hypothetical protein